MHITHRNAITAKNYKYIAHDDYDDDDKDNDDDDYDDGDDDCEMPRFEIVVPTFKQFASVSTGGCHGMRFAHLL